MNLLSLTYAEFERLLKGFAIVTSVIAGGIFAVRIAFETPILTAAWQAISSALTVAGFIFGFFAKRTWNYPLLAKWFGRPIVHGLWRGTLNTSYKRPDGQVIPPIEIAFVIRQTYLSLSIESFTSSQEGESKVEALIQNMRTDATRICYIFELRRQYNGENKLTTGSGELKLLDAGNRLKGHYWTNSPTHGDLELRLLTRDCEDVNCYEVAERKWLELSRSLKPE